MKITITCCFCADHTELQVPTPAGWANTELYEEQGFCPKHATAEPFTHDQCPGCVGSWGDCMLWDAFAFSDPRRRTLADDDFAQLERGVCPKRTGGTFGVSNTSAGVTIDDIDLSEVSPAGAAVASAIRDYIEAYATQPDWPSAKSWDEKRTDSRGREWEWRGRWELASR